MMHLIFPNFSVNAPLPADSDLRLYMEELTDEEWLSSDFTNDTDSKEDSSNLDRNSYIASSLTYKAPQRMTIALISVAK